MTVDNFGRSSARPVMGRSGLTLKVANNNFLRRDGTNAVTGSINMNGNTLTNVSNPKEDQDVATKSYVDSTDALSRVSKLRDVMDVDLRFNVNTGSNRVLGCTNLPRGKRFSLALGSTGNRFQFQNTQTPVTLETTHGFLIRARNNSVCRIGNQNNPPEIFVHTDIKMNSNRILFLTDPAYPHEAVSRNYVDRQILSMSFLSYECHIPPLERAECKTGFVVSTSSRLSAFTEGWLAFNSGKAGEWVREREGSNAWIQISSPTAVRIWKIRLTGRRSNSERITSWKLSGGTGETDVLTDFYSSNTTLGSNVQEFLIDARESYSVFRLTVISADSNSRDNSARNSGID